MKKNYNCKLIVWLLAASIAISTPRVVLAMETIRSKARWMQSKAARAKEKTIDRLVKQYKATQELRRKKATGTATPAELATLERRMKKIKIAAAAIGITLATIAAIAAGAVGYKWYQKRRILAKEEKINTVVAQIQANQSTDERNANLRNAIEKENIDKVKIYLQAGANPNTGSILDLAIIKKNAPLVQMLTDAGASVEEALHRAALSQASNEIVKILIDAGANPNEENYFGETPLYLAAQAGSFDVLQALIKAGADVNFKKEHRVGITPLHSAILSGNTRIVAALIKAGADLTIENVENMTPLHLAAGRCNLAIIRSLIDAGANMNFENRLGKTPLSNAIFYHCDNIVKLLVKNGVEIRKKDLNLAEEANPKMFKYLQQTIEKRMQVALPRSS